MGDGMPAIGGTSGVYAGGAGGQEQSTTVQKGETTLRQVSDRVGYGEQELRDAILKLRTSTNCR